MADPNEIIIDDSLLDSLLEAESAVPPAHPIEMESAPGLPEIELLDLFDPPEGLSAYGEMPSLPPPDAECADPPMLEMIAATMAVAEHGGWAALAEGGDEVSAAEGGTWASAGEGGEEPQGFTDAGAQVFERGTVVPPADAFTPSGASVFTDVPLDDDEVAGADVGPIAHLLSSSPALTARTLLPSAFLRLPLQLQRRVCTHVARASELAQAIFLRNCLWPSLSGDEVSLIRFFSPTVLRKTLLSGDLERLSSGARELVQRHVAAAS